MGRASFRVLGITRFWLTSSILLMRQGTKKTFSCVSISHPTSSRRPSGKESRDYYAEGRREDEPDMGHLGSAFPHRLLSLFLPISILRKQEFYGFHGNHQPGPFNQQNFHFPGQGRLGPFRTFSYTVRAVATATS